MAEYKGVKEPDEDAHEPTWEGWKEPEEQDGPWRVVIQPRSVTPAENAATDDKGFSEETCVRCGWRMGSPALNCQNNNTPHVFPSQDALLAQAEAAEELRKQVEWQAEELDAVEGVRDAAGRAAEQAQAALRQIAEWPFDTMVRGDEDGEIKRVARAALTGEGTE